MPLVINILRVDKLTHMHARTHARTHAHTHRLPRQKQFQETRCAPAFAQNVPGLTKLKITCDMTTPKQRQCNECYKFQGYTQSLLFANENGMTLLPMQLYTKNLNYANSCYSEL